MTHTVIYYMSINFIESLWIQGQTLIVTSYTLCDTMAIFNDDGGSGIFCNLINYHVTESFTDL